MTPRTLPTPADVVTPSSTVPKQIAPAERPVPVPLSTLVESWVSEGLISSAQAEQIRGRGDVAVALPAAPHKERQSLVVEALGYLGGVIILVAAILIASLYWEDVTTPAQLTIVGAAAVLFLVAGLLVGDRLGAVGVRLNSVLWLLSVAAVAGFLALLTTDTMDLHGIDAGLTVSLGVAVYGSLLWARLPLVPQQLVAMAALAATAGLATAQLEGPEGLQGVGVWGVGVVWALLGWGGLLKPGQLVVSFGALTTVVGAMATMSTDAGIGFAIGTTALVIVFAVLLRDLMLLAVGAIGTLQVLPGAVSEWFPGDLSAPLALLVIGALLIGAAIWIARRRHVRTEAEKAGRDYSEGTRKAAVIAASSVAVGVAAAVLVIAAI